MNSSVEGAPCLRAGKIKLTTHKQKEGLTDILMSEQRSFWQRIFGRTGSSSLSPRQQKVSDYILIHPSAWKERGLLGSPAYQATPHSPGRIGIGPVEGHEKPLPTGPMPYALRRLVASGCASQRPQLPENFPHGCPEKGNGIHLAPARRLLEGNLSALRGYCYPAIGVGRKLDRDSYFR